MPAVSDLDLDPLVLVPEVHEPLQWPRAVPAKVADKEDYLRGTYPYRGFTPRPREEAALRLWLQGAPVDGVRDADAPSLDGSAFQRWARGSGAALPGGAALVAGLRGVGKTTLVRKVLYDVSVAARHGLRLGPWEALPDALAVLKRRADGSLVPAASTPRLYVPVQLDVATAISPEAMLRRLLRRTYLALAAHQVGDLDPHLMRRARTAWVRSLGQVKETLSKTLSDQVGLSTDLLTKLEVTASQELEFARSLEVVAQQLTVEDAEDELVDLGRTLSQGPSGAASSTAKGTWSALIEGAQAFVGSVKRSTAGSKGVQVIITVLVDELDKLPRKGPGEANDLDTAQDVLMRLKTVLTAEGLVAVAVAGHETEWRWNQERFQLDANLRSLFSRHIYVPALGREEVATFIKRHRPKMWNGLSKGAKKGLVDAASFESRGRYKDLLRWSGRLRVAEGGLAKRLGDALGSWGSLDATEGRQLLRQGARSQLQRQVQDLQFEMDGPGYAPDPQTHEWMTEQLKRLQSGDGSTIQLSHVLRATFVECTSLEQVAVTLAALSRGSVTMAFAQDLARGVVLAQLELALTHAGGLESDEARLLQSDLYQEAGRLVPQVAVQPALQRVSSLIEQVVREDLMADLTSQSSP